MKNDISDAEIFLAIRDWFKSTRWSSWFFGFAGLNILILFIDLLFFAFGGSFIQEGKAIGGFVIFALLCVAIGGFLQMDE